MYALDRSQRSYRTAAVPVISDAVSVPATVPAVPRKLSRTLAVSVATVAAAIDGK
jgi:hypothetical protein